MYAPGNDTRTTGRRLRNGASRTQRHLRRFRRVAGPLAASVLATSCSVPGWMPGADGDPLVPPGAQTLEDTVGPEGGTIVSDQLSVTFDADPDRPVTDLRLVPGEIELTDSTFDAEAPTATSTATTAEPGSGTAVRSEEATADLAQLRADLDAERSALLEHDGELGPGTVRVLLSDAERDDEAAQLLIAVTEPDGGLTFAPTRLDRERGIAIATVPHFSGIAVFSPTQEWIRRQLQAAWKDMLLADFGDYLPVGCTVPASNVEVTVTGQERLTVTHDGRELVPLTAVACARDDRVAIRVVNNSRVPFTTYFRTPYGTPRPDGFVETDDPVDYLVAQLGARGVLVPRGPGQDIGSSLILPATTTGAYLLAADPDSEQKVVTRFTPDFGMAVLYTGLVALNVLPGTASLKGGRLVLSGVRLTATQSKTVIRIAYETFDDTGAGVSLRARLEDTVTRLRAEPLYRQADDGQRKDMEKLAQTTAATIDAFVCGAKVVQPIKKAVDQGKTPSRAELTKAIDDFWIGCLPSGLKVLEKHADMTRPRSLQDLLAMQLSAPLTLITVAKDLLNKTYVAGLTAAVGPLSQPVVTAQFRAGFARTVAYAPDCPSSRVSRGLLIAPTPVTYAGQRAVRPDSFVVDCQPSGLVSGPETRQRVTGLQWDAWGPFASATGRFDTGYVDLRTGERPPEQVRLVLFNPLPGTDPQDTGTGTYRHFLLTDAATGTLMSVDPHDLVVQMLPRTAAQEDEPLSLTAEASESCLTPRAVFAYGNAQDLAAGCSLPVEVAEQLWSQLSTQALYATHSTFGDCNGTVTAFPSQIELCDPYQTRLTQLQWAQYTTTGAIAGSGTETRVGDAIVPGHSVSVAVILFDPVVYGGRKVHRLYARQLSGTSSWVVEPLPLDPAKDAHATYAETQSRSCLGTQDDLAQLSLGSGDRAGAAERCGVPASVVDGAV